MSEDVNDEAYQAHQEAAAGAAAGQQSEGLAKDANNISEEDYCGLFKEHIIGQLRASCGNILDTVLTESASAERLKVPCNFDKNFPWKKMLSFLHESKLILVNWPIGVRHPGDSSTVKGISSLYLKERKLLAKSRHHKRYPLTVRRRGTSDNG